MSWNEWSVDEVGDIHDEKRWYDANPALGIRLDIGVVRAEASTMNDVSFAQERLGYWIPKYQFVAVINENEWKRCETKNPPEDGKLTYAVKFSADGATVSLAVAFKPKSGPALFLRSISHSANQEIPAPMGRFSTISTCAGPDFG